MELKKCEYNSCLSRSLSLSLYIYMYMCVCVCVCVRAFLSCFQDLKKPLLDYRPKLQGTTFQESLGSMYDKSVRVEGMISDLANCFNASEAALETAKQASPLAMADLATALVMEFTGLAGVLGKHYALKSGTNEEVAECIFESVLPRKAGDLLPASQAGALLAMSDRSASNVLFHVHLSV